MIGRSLCLCLSSVAPTNASFKCSYIVSNAGWSPVYDLRSEGIAKDVALNYKANVYQNTGQNWDNVNMSISTGNPAINNDRPILNPLYAKYYVANYNRGNDYPAGTNIKLESNMMYAEEVIVEDKKYKDGFYHTWYLGTTTDVSAKEIANTLDASLKDANKNYQVARSKALQGVKVFLVDPEVFYNWNDRNKKKGGQVKMERVMGEDTFAQWEEFVKD